MRRALLFSLLLTACAAGAEVREESWPETGKLRYRGVVVHEGSAALAQREWVFWYPDGTLQARGGFRRGMPPGPRDLAADRTRVPERGRHGHWTFWSRAGQVLAEGSYDHGRREGLWTFWHENGLRASQGNYHAGHPTGVHVRWHEGGLRSELARYRDGRLDGRRQLWDSEGELVWAGDYQDGELSAVRTGERASEPPLALATTPAPTPPDTLRATHRPE